MDIFDSSYYRINKWLLLYSGFWPYQDPTIKRLVQSFEVFTITNFIIPQILYILKVLNNVDSLLFSMPTISAGIIILMKMYLLASKEEEMRQIINEVCESWSVYSTGTEQQILKKYAKLGQIYTLSYGSVNSIQLQYTLTVVAVPCLAVFAFYPVCVPILDIIYPLSETRSRNLPHPAEYFVDQDRYYWLLVSSECISYTMGTLFIVGSDTIYVMLVQHCCGMFTILRFVQLLTSIFEAFTSVEVICGTIMHCTASIMIVIYMDQPEYVIKFGMVLITQSLRLFISNWPGQKLMDHSADVAISAYCGVWYRMSVKARKLLLFLIMDAQKPHTLIIAGLYPIDLNSFAAVMRSSLSYCTVMASLRTSSAE